MAITAASRPRPAHLSSELKYGAAMRHTAARVERIFFTDHRLREIGLKALKGWRNQGLLLRLWRYLPAAACRSGRPDPSMAAAATGGSHRTSRGCEGWRGRPRGLAALFPQSLDMRPAAPRRRVRQ